LGVFITCDDSTFLKCFTISCFQISLCMMQSFWTKLMYYCGTPLIGHPELIQGHTCVLNEGYKDPEFLTCWDAGTLPRSKAKYLDEFCYIPMVYTCMNSVWLLNAHTIVLLCTLPSLTIVLLCTLYMLHYYFIVYSTLTMLHCCVIVLPYPDYVTLLSQLCTLPSLCYSIVSIVYPTLTLLHYCVPHPHYVTLLFHCVLHPHYVTLLCHCSTLPSLCYTIVSLCTPPSLCYIIVCVILSLFIMIPIPSQCHTHTHTLHANTYSVWCGGCVHA